MKGFLKEQSYNMVKMFLDQFAAAIFGFSLALVSSKVGNVALRNATSIGSILFYLFLLYTMTWEIGFHDRGKKEKMPQKGLFLSIGANAVNFLLALIIMLATLLPKSFFSDVGGVCGAINLFINGMYTGILANQVGGASLNSYWFVYFLLPIPSMLICWVSYRMGLADKKFTPLFNHVYPESDRDGTKKTGFFKK